ncbi:oxidoreductase [Neptunitalea chrysea]|uniref:Oxidoreductase n=1 Tax=Neptunitalea chrysea TaxID=1647581 RepID=A0A9W6EUL3_9FLAO|nr:aldo/keto reductase [Neptunitalea chrysea]GLB52729.1 oxidoreductase [Neptunitalea chrysea]
MKNLQISHVVAGTMTWGQWGKKLRTKEMATLQNFCFENGITTFDHADIYGNHTTEADFGKAFLASGLDRSKVQFITKCGVQMMGKNRSHKIKHYNYSKEHILQSVDTSLDHLKTDYLDMLLLHRPSPLLDPAEVGETIKDLKESGKVKHFGVSNFTQVQTDVLNAYVPVETNQIELSLTFHEVMNNGSLEHMMLHKIQPMAWSPLGNYFKKQYPTLKQVMAQLCDKYHVEEDALLIAWVLKHPANIIPVIGTTRFERIKKSLEAKNIPLTIEDWFLMREAVTGHPVP